MTVSILGQGNTALKNQEQNSQGDTGGTREEGNMIRDKRKARQDFKMKQETKT